MHFCLQKLHLLPHQFDQLPKREKAMVIASVQVRVDDEAEQAKKLNKKKGKHGRKR